MYFSWTCKQENMKHFKFRKIEGITGILNNRVFWIKIPKILKNGFFAIA